MPKITRSGPLVVHNPRSGFNMVKCIGIATGLAWVLLVMTFPQSYTTVNERLRSRSRTARCPVIDVSTSISGHSLDREYTSTTSNARSPDCVAVNRRRKAGYSTLSAS